MTNSIHVGRAQPADLIAVLPLMRAYYAASPVPHAYDDEQMRQWLAPLTDHHSPRGALLVAKVRDQLAGFAVCYLGASTRQMTTQVELQDLLVASAFRRRGVARQLLAGVRTYARSQNAQTVIWQTRTSNLGAQALYDEVGEREAGWLHYSMAVAEK